MSFMLALIPKAIGDLVIIWCAFLLRVATSLVDSETFPIFGLNALNKSLSEITPNSLPFSTTYSQSVAIYARLYFIISLTPNEK